MIKPAPDIDLRRAAQIIDQVQDLLVNSSAPGWQRLELDVKTNELQPKGINAALVGIFARYAELIIQRLNRVPEKNFLAFLDLLGAAQLPPQPARVPLTFFLAAGSTADGIVPAGTQVAAPPTEAEQDPVIFETERELVVTATQLISVFVRDPIQDQYGDRTPLLDKLISPGLPIFKGDRPIEHILSIQHNVLFNNSAVAEVRLTVELAESVQDPRTVIWEIWDGEIGIPFQSISSNSPLWIQDNTNHLTTNGIITFSNLRSTSAQPGHLLMGRQLRCRLLTPITPATQPQGGRVRVTQLPQITSLTFQTKLNRTDLKVQNSFANQIPLDLNTPFFPFGERPRFGDTLYLDLADNAAFTKGGELTLTVAIVDPANAGMSSTVTNPSLRLQWEFWDGQQWIALGISIPPNATLDADSQRTNATNNFQDNTQAFTIPGSNTIRFTFPTQPEATIVNGITSAWIRVRITAGDYGKEATYVPDLDENRQPRRVNGNLVYILTPATFAPPIVSAIAANYVLDYAPEQEAPAEHILIYNDFQTEIYTPEPEQDNQGNVRTDSQGNTLYKTDGQGRILYALTSLSSVSRSVTQNELFPFQPTPDILPSSRPNFYLGFRPPDELFPNRPLNLFFRLSEVVYGQPVENPAAAVAPRLAWQYWNGQTWIKLTVRDGTEAFTRSGLVEFLVPDDFQQSTEFGIRQYWLQIQWETGDYLFTPHLQRILLNTTMASQTITLRNEVLGSSNGSANQRFTTVRTPILTGQQLDVREPEIPPSTEQRKLQQEEENDQVITITPGTADGSQEVWVRWHEVPDFYGSGPRDRHYILNHISGEIHFGDGINGLIPPPNIGNLRMTRYQTGGGSIGNRPPEQIVQLKTTVPYVEQVINTEASLGGADAESLDSLRDRVPRTIRHRNRAVTREDYEDLAMLASPAVARARCVPLHNLEKDPLDQQPDQPGEVSVIIVPRSPDSNPQPSVELTSRVKNYLQRYSLPTVNLSVVGPLYVRVNVSVEITLVSLEGASSVEQEVEQRLTNFLHPLTGGFENTGWNFGRQPHKSDFYALLEPISGVDHIHSLQLDPPEDISQISNTETRSVIQTARFLVYSGEHQIKFRIKDER